MLDSIKPYLGTAAVVLVILFIVKRVAFLKNIVG